MDVKKSFEHFLHIVHLKEKYIEQCFTNILIQTSMYTLQTITATSSFNIANIHLKLFTTIQYFTTFIMTPPGVALLGSIHLLCKVMLVFSMVKNRLPQIWMCLENIS